MSSAPFFSGHLLELESSLHDAETIPLVLQNGSGLRDLEKTITVKL